MKELKKKYIKPYACVHECAYEENLMDISGGAENLDGKGSDDEFPEARPSGNNTFFELDNENEDF